MTPRRLPSPGQDRRRGPSVARAPSSRTRYPYRYNSRYCATWERAQAFGSRRRSTWPARRARWAGPVRGGARQRATPGALDAWSARSRCAPLLDLSPISPCSPYQTMFTYANIRKNTLPYMQMFAYILRFRKEIKKFNFFEILACNAARDVVDFARFPDKGLRARRRKEKAIPFWRLYVRPAMAPSRRATAELLNGARRP